MSKCYKNIVKTSNQTWKKTSNKKHSSQGYSGILCTLHTLTNKLIIIERLLKSYHLSYNSILLSFCLCMSKIYKYFPLYYTL